MAKRDYYDILGVAKGSSADELKSAYRKQAMKLHPDRNPGNKEAEAKFKEVNEAYDVLKDDQKRAAYDRFGHAAFENGGGGRGPGGGDPFGGFSSSFSDMFEDLFGEMMGGGGHSGGRRQDRGGDLRYNLEISLEDAFNGKRVEIRVPAAVSCDACKGSGAEAGSHAENCPTCGGRGRVRASQGFFTVERTCPTCRGAGRIIKKPCKICGGSGQVQKERTLAIDIPPGVEEGTRIRLTGEGQAGFNGGPAGDLYVFLSVAQHAIFQRDGADLYAQVPVTFITAALSGSIEVPTLDGEPAKLAIAEGTQSGRRIRLRHKGMPVLRGGGARGDLYIEVKVETPVKLTKKQKELLKEFEAESSSGSQPECESFFAKVKSFLNGEA
ncbi:MAG: molecular chaperone DnaJ [Rhizomicrobium sp.]